MKERILHTFLVAQTSKSAVSQVPKRAMPALYSKRCRFGNLRYRLVALWSPPSLALLTALMLMPLGRAAAQSFTILRSFGILTNVTGFYPQSTLVQGGNGTLYGTTSGGEGSVTGTVFSVQSDGSGFTVLKRFMPSPSGNYLDGASPRAGLTLSGSTLYGTTYSGGSSNYGTVFKLNTDGTGYTVLHHFGFSPGDGENPAAGLTLSGSTLYGTTCYGSDGSGTVFKLNTDGTGHTVLHNFTGPDGAIPAAGLTLSGSTLYGTTSSGGTSGFGTVFKLNTDGTGYTVLWNFSGSDGASPQAPLILSGSTLYGTTSTGSAFVNPNDGTVFSINTDGTGFTVLYGFAGSGDGASPQAGLTLSGSTLYGTTYSTYLNGGPASCGTVFSINTDGTGFTVVYSFTGFPDGANPQAGLTLSGNTLYGTTEFGGTGGPDGLDGPAGTVFSLNTDGTGYTVLKNFTCSDGQSPYSGLTQSGNTLYGTTELGGGADGGTMFSLNTDGTGYTVLKSFTVSRVTPPPDGFYPDGAVALAGNTIYGTTIYGGVGDGTVFSLNTDGTGYTVLYNFTGGFDGAEPTGRLILSGETLYGTTPYGGSGDSGTVFSLKTDGTGYTLLHDFTNSPDGSQPYAGVTLSGNTLYGTTRYGGSVDGGTVFSLNTDGTSYTVLYNFLGLTNGYYPDAGLTLSGSTLYGTTTLGGSNNHGGTLFKLGTDGTSYSVLHNFINVPDGAVPETGLTLSGSTLYGTTSSGGSLTNGTLFKVKTDGSGYAVLWNFSGRPSDLILSGSTLYGTTAGGGALGEGAIFSLNVAPVLNITPIHTAVVLSWDDPAFNLQSAPEAAGPYTNIRGATSPYTKAITGGRQFFRLVTP